MVAPPRTPLRVDRLRALNAPRRIDVEVDGRGAPRTIVLKPRGDGGGWRTMEEDEKRWTVESVGEIWRVDDEWWRQPISRRYVEVMLEAGGHTMLFEDLLTHEWFIQSI